MVVYGLLTCEHRWRIFCYLVMQSADGVIKMPTVCEPHYHIALAMWRLSFKRARLPPFCSHSLWPDYSVSPPWCVLITALIWLLCLPFLLLYSFPAASVTMEHSFNMAPFFCVSVLFVPYILKIHTNTQTFVQILIVFLYIETLEIQLIGFNKQYIVSLFITFIFT